MNLALRNRSSCWKSLCEQCLQHVHGELHQHLHHPHMLSLQLVQHLRWRQEVCLHLPSWKVCKDPVFQVGWIHTATQACSQLLHSVGAHSNEVCQFKYWHIFTIFSGIFDICDQLSKCYALIDGTAVFLLIRLLAWLCCTGKPTPNMVFGFQCKEVTSTQLSQQILVL